MALKILVIEDDLILAEGLVENLLDLGYSEVKTASRYKEVLALLKEFEPDIFIVDIYLKGSAKNGIEIISEVNKEQTIPVIYLTSFDDNEYRDKAKETSPSAYLIKPASRQQIDVAIDFALSSFAKTNPSLSSQSTNLEDSLNLYKGVGYFFIKTRDRYEKITESELLYLKASGTYTILYTDDRSFMVATNIKRLLPQLNQNIMLRCHRSYAVNKNKIKAFDEANIFLQGKEEIHTIPLSRRYKVEINNKIVKIKTE